MDTKNLMQKHLDETVNNVRFSLAKLNSEVGILQTQYMLAIKYKTDMDPINKDIIYLSKRFINVKKALDDLKKMSKR